MNAQRGPDLSRVTRFEVIDHTPEGQGREYVRYGVRVELSVQDDGRTLKVFLSKGADLEPPK